MNDHAIPIIGVLNRHPEIELAILFGSLATGTPRFDSDVDLAVSAGQPLTEAQRMALIAELAEATGRPVDLVDLMRAGEPLLGQILAKGRHILGNKGQYARLLSRHWFEQADFLPYRNRILAERRAAWIGK